MREDVSADSKGLMEMPFGGFFEADTHSKGVTRELRGHFDVSADSKGVTGARFSSAEFKGLMAEESGLVCWQGLPASAARGVAQVEVGFAEVNMAKESPVRWELVSQTRPEYKTRTPPNLPGYTTRTLHSIIPRKSIRAAFG